MTPNGAALRAIRQAKGVSLRDLAEAAELHRSFVSRVERGLAGASRESLRRLADALAVSPDAITKEGKT